MAETLEPNQYQYFDRKAERSDIFKFSRGIAEYIEREGVRNVLFVDRSARTAWVGVDEFWNQHFKDIPKPGFYFVNPDGFDPDLVEVPELQRSALLREFVKAFDVPLLGASDDDREETMNSIAERFEEVFKRLSDQKDQPLLLFDTCSHTGGTIHNIVKILDRLGFEDVRIITANSPDADSGIVPDARIDRHTRLVSCYPFGEGSMVRKRVDVVSERDPDPRQRLVGTVIRKEIRSIVRTGGR
jgi:hypothetical protein